MRYQLVFIALFYSLFSIGQTTTIDFESFTFGDNTFLNGSDLNGGFTLDQIFLPNNFNTEFSSWVGWAISKETDTQTPGLTNQYSAMAGSGVDNSSNYAVSYHFVPNTLVLTGDAAGQEVDGVFITNNAYAYYSILDGDMFSKKFGGVTGNDPDYYLLTIKKWYDGALGQDSVNFYLADYRFEDNGQDYIVKDWTFVDLSPLGKVDSLSFILSSTDNGQFGMNTPAYFCIDNLTTTNGVAVSNQNLFLENDMVVFPNPFNERLTIRSPNLKEPTQLSISNLQGQRLLNTKLDVGEQEIDLSHFAQGSYLLQVNQGDNWSSQIIIKQ